MALATEFRRYAEECRRMAATSLSRDDRETWNKLAERWLCCAANADKEADAARAFMRARRAAPSRRVARVTGRTQQAA
jgi:hypothetical protein